MTGTVSNVGDKLFARSFRIPQQTVYSLDDNVNDIYIFPFVETTDIVGLIGFTFMEDNIYVFFTICE